MLARHHGVGGSEMASCTCLDFGLGCQLIAFSLCHMVTLSMWPLQHNSLGSREHKQRLSGLFRPGLGLTASALLVPSARRKEAKTSVSSRAPQNLCFPVFVLMLGRSSRVPIRHLGGARCWGGPDPGSRVTGNAAFVCIHWVRILHREI